ncbi:hypothetical protein GCM10028774_54300 [Spirosoma jeollabukense]
MDALIIHGDDITTEVVIVLRNQANLIFRKRIEYAFQERCFAGRAAACNTDDKWFSSHVDGWVSNKESWNA